MSVKSRHEQRLELVSVFIQELMAVDKDYLELVFQFILSIAILYLIFVGKVGGTVGVFGVSFIMSVDLARAFEAWQNARQKTRRTQERQD